MNTHQLQVLLIEDDLADYRLITRGLRKTQSGIQMVWAQSLGAGLEELAKTRFDVVLTDLSLPDSVGVQAVERIRALDQSIPIVVLTTLDDEQTELKSLTIGAQDYLIKDTCVVHTLERAIHHAIQRQENLIEIQRLLNELEFGRDLLNEQKTLLQKKNRRLRRLYKTAHRFVDNVSHEFRTPLTVIKDYVSLVREGLVGDINDEQCRMLDIASVRVDDLNNMVDDMLNVSKLESGLLGVWRRPCRLTEIVESVCPPLLKKAAVKNIGFDITVPDSLPVVYCDGENIGRIIINLVTNAMKFCGDPGSVRLWADAREDCQELVVNVTDNGPGIEERGLAQIFQRFKQLRNQPKQSTKGFGLGLNIAQELVELNFGEMSVESRVGHGTTFSFTVPINNPPHILVRYLRRLGKRKTGTPVATLIHAQACGTTDVAQADGLDSFFSYLLRRQDILFHTAAGNWLFVLPAVKSEVAGFLARATDEWEQTNRNRPFGPLPAFEMHTLGTWNIAKNADVILQRFTEIIEDNVVYSCQ